MKSNKELVEYVIHSAEVRMKKPFFKLALSSIFAGMFIALGALGNILVSADLIETNLGLSKFIGATVFPVGLMVIVILGFDLFTSNCLMTIGLVEKKYNILNMLKILVIVWVFNLIGSIFIVYITHQTHTLTYGGEILLESMAKYKVSVPGYNIFLKGILCNILVAGASLLGYIAKDSISKIFGIWFPIMLFIVLGYDHIVANMFYLPLAYINGTEGIYISNIMHNFTYATLGNFVGGGILLGLSMWYLNKN